MVVEPGLGQVTGPGNVRIEMKSSPVLRLISLVRLYVPACHTIFVFLQHTQSHTLSSLNVIKTHESYPP
jgi:hypothetical protein